MSAFELNPDVSAWSWFGELHSAELLLHTVDFQQIVDMQKSGRWPEAGERLAAVARGLEAGGAECVLIGAVTFHLVADAVAAATQLPFIHIVDVVADRLESADKKNPLLIATRYTIENGFYQERMANRGIDVVIPDDSDRGAVHRIIFEELSLGKVTEASRTLLLGSIEKAAAAGADSVILGCCLILDPGKLPLPGFDSTAIHIEEAVEFALSPQS